MTNYKLEDVTHQREDGTYVGIVMGMPYHITPNDPLWEKAVEIAGEKSENLVPDPPIVADLPKLSLTARQLRLGLLKANITSSSVLTSINTIKDPLKREEMLVEWEYGTQFSKTNVLVEFLKEKHFSNTSAFEDFWNNAFTL